MYSLTKIKQAGGEETPRFEATLTKADPKWAKGTIHEVGHVSNGGTGGCCRWDFKDRAEREAFEAWIKEHHQADFEPDDAWAYKQLDAEHERKQVMRWSKTKTVFKLDGDNPGEGFRTLKVPFRGWDSPAGVYLLEKHAGLGEVYNPATRSWIRIQACPAN